MDQGTEDAMRWEMGCREDFARNDFIAPSLARILESHRPATILDVGTGTAYLPRVIDQALSYRPLWTLLDLDRPRLNLAEQLVGPTMRAITVEADITEYDCQDQFSAVLATFTMLEIADLPRFIKRLPSLVCERGLFIVCTPDAWRDVLTHAAHAPDVVQEFLQGSVALPKVDKFTGNTYPFQAVRIERIISQVMAVGFDLIQLDESDAGVGAYVLSFLRRPRLR